MHDLFSVNSDWLLRILCEMSDNELKEAFDTLQKFYALCDSSDVSIYYELLDLLKGYFVQEIIRRFYLSIA